MAHMRKRKLANGRNAYQIRYVDPSGVERSEQHGRLEDARRRIAEVESSLFRGAYVDPAAGRTTFKEYAERWRNMQVHRATSAKQHERELRLHVYPTIGARGLATLKRSDVQGLAKKLAGTLAPNTIAGIMATVASVFTSAVLDGMIASSPAVKIALPKVNGADLVIPTVKQVIAIAGHEGLPKRYRALVMVAATTGLRRNELFGASLETVNFLRRTVTVRPDLGQLVTAPRAVPVLGPPKTEASARVVPLGDVAASALAEHLREFPANSEDGYGGLIFRGARKPYCSEAFYTSLAPVLREFGFPAGTGLHLFRHFYASALIAHGENPKVVQKRLGHASITETMDTYGHLWPENEETSRTAIDAAFEPDATPLRDIRKDA